MSTGVQRWPIGQLAKNPSKTRSRFIVPLWLDELPSKWLWMFEITLVHFGGCFAPSSCVRLGMTSILCWLVMIDAISHDSRKYRPQYTCFCKKIRMVSFGMGIIKNTKPTRKRRVGEAGVQLKRSYYRFTALIMLWYFLSWAWLNFCELVRIANLIYIICLRSSLMVVCGFNFNRGLLQNLIIHTLSQNMCSCVWWYRRKLAWDQNTILIE